MKETLNGKTPGLLQGFLKNKTEKVREFAGSGE
jgi:hypothetical protein